MHHQGQMKEVVQAQLSILDFPGRVSDYDSDPHGQTEYCHPGRQTNDGPLGVLNIP